MTGKQLILLGLALLTVASVGSCQSVATPTLPALSEPGIAVGLSDDSCPTVTVKAGQQISWTNQGQHEHIIRAKSLDGQIEFESGPIQPGDSFAVTMAQPGTYRYECTVDGSFTGTITVEP